MKTGICALMSLSVVMTAAPEPQAVEIARGMMQAMGGEAAWKQARYVRFEFIVKIRGQARVARAHLWDKLKEEEKGIGGGLRCKTVPHITLKSISHNDNLDPIFARHDAILSEKLAAANEAVQKVPDKLRHDLRMKLLTKQKREGKKAITDADQRRWELPAKGKSWQHWEVPFEIGR